MTDSRDINELHPCLARGARELIRRMEAHGYPVGISSTYRDNEAQDALYEQGRTKPGNIVTNARGGQSLHNYRLAFDVFLNIKGQEFSNNAFFNLAGKIWIEMGGQWGGSWVGFVDKPHMEFTGGLSLSDLQRGKRLDDGAIMKWETNKEPEPDETTEDNDTSEIRYNTLEELPIWAGPAIEALLERELLIGDGIGFDLSYDMLRMFVINYRAGLYS